MSYYPYIKGLGMYLPKKVLTNEDLEKMVDTSDEWIFQRTGIKSRHIAGDGELPSDMALQASLMALKNAGIDAKKIDLIMVATLYPDRLMPNTACTLQHKLSLEATPAFDLSAACSGFIYGLSIANQFIASGTYKNILLVGTESLHHVVNYKDRGSCIIFGDGAGAVVLTGTTDPEKAFVYHQELKSFGNLSDILYIESPGAKSPPCANTPKENYCITMNGKIVFKKAVKILCDMFEKTLKDSKKTKEDIDWIVAHQANVRILKSFAKIVHFPEEKIILDIETIGNTSSASIPISLHRAVAGGKIKRGKNVLFMAVGGGMTSGCMLMKY